VVFVEFFHDRVARAVFTCSGSFRSHCLDSSVSRLVTVVIVLSVLPFFFMCHA